MPSDAQRTQWVKFLLEQGYRDRLLIAQDIHTKHRLVGWGGREGEGEMRKGGEGTREDEKEKGRGERRRGRGEEEKGRGGRRGERDRREGGEKRRRGQERRCLSIMWCASLLTCVR